MNINIKIRRKRASVKCRIEWIKLKEIIKIVFFFQAEDGIRDDLVTGVQTCALPIFDQRHFLAGGSSVESGRVTAWAAAEYDDVEIGHALATSRSVCAISAGCGIVASSSAGLVGTGVFFAVIRATGWSKCQKHFSCTSAAISEPNPSLRAASCRTTARAVFLTDVTIVSMSSGTNVRISTTSTEIPSLSNSSATSTPCDTPAEYVIKVTSRPSRTTLA